ncbi:MULTISPECIES: hypothetical protein [unclassified Afipia]|uniref:hypothetical protein n=1 Tax=unclassified Afipia TaxID=2642050 RepID=UPI000463BF0F|nr:MULTISPECIES: hypothetical protein [unclassified Afipia]
MAKKPRDVFEHLRQETPGPKGSALKKWMYEKRGARWHTSEVFHNPELTLAAAQMKADANDKYAMFFKAANVWLGEVQEADFFKVASLAQSASADSPPEQRDAIESFAFLTWAGQVAGRHGALSPAAVAASFLALSDHLHRMVNGNRELLNAIYAFADAYHWMHFEGTGEHELAAIGVASEAARAKGPETKKRERGQKEAVTRDALKVYIEQRPGRAVIPTTAARTMLSDLNETLKGLKLRPYEKTSLEKAIRAILKSA